MDLVMINESRVWLSHQLEERQMEVQSKDNIEIESKTHTAPVLVTRKVLDTSQGANI